MSNQISNEQSEVLKIVEKYGCLDIAQVYILYDPLDRASIDFMVNMLVTYKMLSVIDGHVLVPYGETTFNSGALSCIWAMMKVSVNTRKEINESFPASEPTFSYMIVDNKDSYIFSYVTKNETVKIRAIQEKIEKDKANKHFNSIYIFVTTDETLKTVIKETDFGSTVYMALLTYNRETKIPTVKLLKKNA